MFHKTSLRLTGLYLLIIMAISLFFSVILYSLAAHEIDRSFQRQGVIINSLPDDQLLVPKSLQQRLAEGRRSASDEAKAHLALNLVFANVGILILAGGLSYILAKRSLEPIERAHHELEQFTADASHEMRTPLAAMRSEIEVALMDKKLSAKDARAVLQSNLEEVENLTNLTSGLLSLARLEEGALDVRLQKLQPVISHAVKTVSRLADQKSIAIRAPKRLKDNALFDASTLEQVMIILLENAIKYSPQKTAVGITATKRRDQVSIQISDEGQGIEPRELSRIFDRFYQADASRTGGGHGLGLPIAEKLVELQSGTINVKSQPGKGSTFTVCLRA